MFKHKLEVKIFPFLDCKNVATWGIFKKRTSDT